MKSVFRFTRIAEWGVHVLVFIVVSLLCLLATSTVSPNSLSYLAIIVAYQLPLFSFSYILNDLSDLRSDRLQGKAKPIQRWPKSAVVLLLAILGFSALGILRFSFARHDILVIAFLQLVFALLYSARPFRLKERGLAGILTAAIVQRLPQFLMLGIVVPLPTLVATYTAVWLVLLGLIFIVEHQLEDFDGDYRHRVRTFAVVHGEGAARSLRLVSYAGVAVWAVVSLPVAAYGASRHALAWALSIVCLSAAIVSLLRWRYGSGGRALRSKRDRSSAAALIERSRPHAVTIVGAGLSGMTAAIQLAEKGIEVDIYETKTGFASKPGDRDGVGNGAVRQAESCHRSSVQCLQFDLDATSSFLRIELGPAFSPIECEVAYLYGRKTVLHRKDRYACERGPRRSSLDYLLYRHALEKGVHIHFGKRPDLAASNESAVIVATGLDPGWYRRLNIPSFAVSGYEARAEYHKGDMLISVKDDYTKGDFAYVASRDGLCYALFFSRNGPDAGDFCRFRRFLDVTTGISFDNWRAIAGSVARCSCMYKDKKILAGALAGMIDPFYLGGVSAALISGRIAALYVTDPEAAKREYSRFRGNINLKRQLWRVASKHYSSRRVNTLCIVANAVLKDVGKL